MRGLERFVIFVVVAVVVAVRCVFWLVDQLVLIGGAGSIVEKMDLLPLIFKRVRVLGSTLRARSEDYQAELIDRFKREAFVHLTGSEGDGLLRVYIYKVTVGLT